MKRFIFTNIVVIPSFLNNLHEVGVIFLDETVCEGTTDFL
jgi:hypothetical protein